MKLILELPNLIYITVQIFKHFKYRRINIIFFIETIKYHRLRYRNLKYTYINTYGMIETII